MKFWCEIASLDFWFIYRTMTSNRWKVWLCNTNFPTEIDLMNPSIFFSFHRRIESSSVLVFDVRSILGRWPHRTTNVSLGISFCFNFGSITWCLFLLLHNMDFIWVSVLLQLYLLKNPHKPPIYTYTQYAYMLTIYTLYFRKRFRKKNDCL